MEAENDKSLTSYQEKSIGLQDAVKQYTKHDVLIAFSGGVDSSLLLKLACESAKEQGTKVYAVTIHTALHPMNDLEIAARVAKEAGAIHKVIRVDELAEAGILTNPVDRCYRCKKYLFLQLQQMAEELKISTIIEGTNEDDLHRYRPGIRAIKELGIISPLAAARMTKAEVRKMAKEYGISVANRPSVPCLATRFPYGTSLTYDQMKKVEQGENYLQRFGFYNVRIRVHGDIARIEVDEVDLEKLILHRREIVEALKQLGYTYITIDLEGFRSGSMDIQIQE